MKNKVKIIILAAGKGTRMGGDLPKALMKIRGESMIEHLLKAIIKSGIDQRPIIVVGHEKEKIMVELGDKYIYVTQKEQLGTGHALKCVKDKIDNEYDTIMVLSSDQPLISSETLLGLIEKHLHDKPKITLGTVVIPDFDDWREGLIKFGRILRDQNDKLKEIIEYKNAGEEEKKIKEVNPAIYAFDGAWLWKNIENLRNNNPQGEYLLTDLIRMACEQNEKIETMPVNNLLELLQPNTKVEIEILEKLMVQ